MMLWNELRKALMKYENQQLCEQGSSLSYSELLLFAEVFSKKLINQKCCAILCASEMASAMALLSCFAAGVTAVPLSIRYGDQHCHRILDNIHPTALITDMSGKLQLIELPSNDYVVPAHHPAVIMNTSGTTGKPKGVMLSEKNLLTNALDIIGYFPICENDTILISRPLYHSAVLTGELLVALMSGAKIVFLSEKFNPLLIWRELCRIKATVFCGTPSMLNMLARYKRSSQDNSVRLIAISGEPLYSKIGTCIRNAFPTAQIFHVYGLTEASPRVSFLPSSLFDCCCECAGIALPSVSLKILREDGTEAQKDETGVLWVKGNNIMLGYYKDSQQTNLVLQNGWLCTGDIAMLDSEGLLFIKGRADDMIIRAGMNIYPQEIEAALKQDTRTHEVVVYGIPDPKHGTQIAMKIVGDFESIDDVWELCKRVLPLYQIPNRIDLVKELLKNGSGKILRGGFQND